MIHVLLVCFLILFLFIFSGRFDRDVYDAVPADPYGARR